jgi:chromosome segregation ATPase
MQIDITALLLGIFSVITSLGLGLLQIRKWKAEAKQAESKAQSDLVEVALKINKQDLDTLRTVNADLKVDLSDKTKDLKDRDVELREMYTNYSKLRKEKEILDGENSDLKLGLEAVQCELEALKSRLNNKDSGETK